MLWKNKAPRAQTNILLFRIWNNPRLITNSYNRNNYQPITKQSEANNENLQTKQLQADHETIWGQSRTNYKQNMPITSKIWGQSQTITYKTITGQSRSFLRLENSFGTVWSLSFAYVHMDEVYPETFGYVCAERKTCLQVPRNKQTKVYICTVHWVLSLYIYSNTCFGRVDGKQSPGRSYSLLLQKEFIL